MNGDGSGKIQKRSTSPVSGLKTQGEQSTKYVANLKLQDPSATVVYRFYIYIYAACIRKKNNKTNQFNNLRQEIKNVILILVSKYISISIVLIVVYSYILEAFFTYAYTAA